MNRFHKVILLRNGAFVGLYRPTVGLLGAKQWKLWRAINREWYGRDSLIGEKDGEPYCNEWYHIPTEIRLTHKNLEALDQMLGAGKHEVERRINAFAHAEAEEVEGI